MIVKVNGATIVLATLVDALCYLYTINYPLPKKDPKKKEFTYLRQLKFLFRHLEQLRQWKTIVVSSRSSRPTAINASWKSNQEKIISVAFDASISGLKRQREKELHSDK